MLSLKERQKLNKQLIKFIDSFADSIKAKSIKLKDKAIDKTITYNNQKKPLTASILVKNHIRNDLKKITYTTEGTFEDFIEKLEFFFINGYNVELTKAEIEFISGKLSSVLDNLTDNTDILIKDIKSILIQNLGNGISEKRLVKELKNLYPAYSRNASTIINTGLSMIYVDSAATKFKKIGFDWYLYAGVNDAIIREIPCSHWVNHKFPSSQLDTVLATRLQLWNCRHNIIPITSEEAENYPLLDLKYA